jgi:hypothetical protein
MNNVGWVRCGNASTSVIERLLRDRQIDLIQFSTNAEGALSSSSSHNPFRSEPLFQHSMHRDAPFGSPPWTTVTASLLGLAASRRLIGHPQKLVKS